MRAMDLSPHPGNPRKITDAQLERLRKSLEEFGDLSGIVFNRKTKRLTGGHQRLKVIPPEAEIHIEKKYKKPTRTGTVAEGFLHFKGERYVYREVSWDNEKETAANLAANKHGGEFENSKLAEFLLALDASNYDMDLTGFDASEIENICAPFIPEKLGLTDEDQIPENVNPITKTGDLWVLGEHRLLCGDCTVKENVERLMGGEKADMVFTDPPYNLASENSLIASTVSQSMKRLKESEWDKNFDINKALQSIDLIKGENSTVYICTSHHLAGKIFDWQKKDAKQGRYCIWKKTNPMPSLQKRHWTWDLEMICYSTYGKHIFNFPESGHAHATWNIPKNTVNDLHPTMKPVAVPEHAILHSSNKGSLVVDIFLGSGSTLIACEKTNRKCYGMEIDPHYCDVIVKRWEDFTGKKAVLENKVRVKKNVSKKT